MVSPPRLTQVNTETQVVYLARVYVLLMLILTIFAHIKNVYITNK
jgi:hypothetical protein